MAGRTRLTTIGPALDALNPFGVFLRVFLSKGFGILVCLIMAATLCPATASAAECTTTWTGPAEGTWQTAGNWSTGKVPGTEDVVCIGTGNTVSVTTGSQAAAAVQGSGDIKVTNGTLSVTGPVEANSLAITGSAGKVTLTTEETSSVASFTIGDGELAGTGSINVTSSFSAPESLGGEGDINGTGKMVLKSGVTGEVTNPVRFSQRTFVNEGTLTLAKRYFLTSNGAVIENKGTLKANSETSPPAFREGSGTAPLVVNTGIFEKTSGSGETKVDVEFKNEGTVHVKSGSVAFAEGGSGVGANSWTADKGKKIVFMETPSFSMGSSTSWAGDFEFKSGSVTASNGLSAGDLTVTMGTLTVTGPVEANSLAITGSAGKVNLSTEKASTVSSFTIGDGELAGTGSINVTSSFSAPEALGGEGDINGTGKTVLKSGVTGEITNPVRLSQRTFVNEGTLTLAKRYFVASNGAVIENTGTLKANSETSPPAFREGSGTAPLIVNTGIFEKTAGSGETKVDIEFKNEGTVHVKSGSLAFTEGGSGVGANSWKADEGKKVVFMETPAFSMGSSTSWVGDFEFKSGTVTASGGLSAGHLIVGMASLTVTGPVEASSLAITGSAGKVTLTTEETSTVSSLTIGDGELAGTGSINVTSSFSAPEALGGEGDMNGTGKTVLKSGVTGEITNPVRLSQRTFVNEGTLTLAGRYVVSSNGAVIENKGTLKANSETSPPAFREGTGAAPLIVNTGNFEKTAGSGETKADVEFKNEGTVHVKSGSVAFAEGGSGVGANSWIADEGKKIVYMETPSFSMGPETSWTGDLEFKSGSFTVSNGLKAANLIVGMASLTVTGPVEANSLAITGSSGKVNLSNEGTSTVSSLTIGDGELTGPGSINVTSSFLAPEALGGEGDMNGTGKTVLKSGVTGEVSNPLRFSQRTFVNQGTLTLSGRYFVASNGAVIENAGTLKANSETSPPAFREGTGAAPLIVNTGNFEKTAGSGETKVDVEFKSEGTVHVKSGSLAFAEGGLGESANSWIADAGKKVVFMETPAFSMGSGTTWTGDFEFKSGSVLAGNGLSAGNLTVAMGTLTVTGPVEANSLAITGSAGKVNLSTEEPSSVASFTIGDGELSGPGPINVTNSFSAPEALGGEGDITGTGKMVLKPGVTGEVTNPVRLSQRTVVNEGTLTLAKRYFVGSNEAVIENRGTLRANSETSPPAFRVGSGTAPLIVNTGNFEKTAGSGETKVDIAFLNHGQIRENSGKLKIVNPITVDPRQRFGMRAQCGDPVDCATGDFYESQTDVWIGGRGVVLEMTRSYSAQVAAAATSPGPFGYGWSGSFSERLVIGEGEVTLIQADGNEIPFTKTGASSYAGPSWSQNTLSGNAETGYILTSGDQTELSFSPTGRLLSVEDRNGNETTLTYDESGRLEEVADPSGRKLSMAYNADDLIESVEDPMGNHYEYAYENDDLVSITYPGQESPRWEFKYDEDHRLTTMTDGREGTTTNVYDAQDRVESQTDPGGDTLTFEYEPLHTVVTNESTGAVTDQWFTSNNQPSAITHGYGTPSAMTETFTYNGAGKLATRTDGNGHTTKYGYDGAGNRTSEKDAEGNETKRAYNGTNDLISITTPGGETTTIARDGQGNPETISRPVPGEATQVYVLGYDGNGQLESLTDPLERTWAYEHDNHGNLVSNIDPLGNTLSYEYDENSRPIATVSRRGNLEGAEPSKFETTIEWDPQGRPVEVEDPLGNVTEFGYDGNGNLTAETDANGKTTKFAYNADNERIKIEKPNGAVLETEYDGAGHVISQTDGEENTTTYVRDVLGRLTEIIDPLSRKTEQEFDAAGNLEAVIDAAKRKATFTYDDADKLIAVDYSDEATPDTSFGYDADGNLTTMVDGTGESSYAYDSLGRLTEVENGNGAIVDYDYDLAEQLTEIGYPNGKAITRAFDEAGRLESITDWLGGITSFVYDADSNLTTIAFPAATGNVDKYAYDPADRMSEASFGKGAETLAEISYARNKAGQLESETVEGLPGPEEILFGYDGNRRLTSAGEASFEYDLADNITQGLGSTNSYDAASQLESGTEVEYEYDALGQRSQVDPVGEPATAYGYDQAGNLISIDRPEEGETPGIAQDLTYDGSGLIASRTAGEATRELTWDVGATNPLLLDDGDNSYIFGPSGLPIAQISSEEEPTYLHHDQLGSTRLLTGAGGVVSATFSYEPYGAQAGSTGSATTPFEFAGELVDPETGLQYLRARFYDPATGQFLSRDPQEAVTRQPYAYAFDDPTNLTDRSGENPALAAACVGTIAVPGVNAGVCGTAAATAAAATAAVVIPRLIEDEEVAGELTIAPGLAARLSKSRTNEETGCKPSDMPNFGDPSQAPGEDWEWRGSGSSGGKEGSWYNPKTGESLHPDTSHPGPIGPHYDYRAPNGSKHRVYPDGRVVPK